VLKDLPFDTAISHLDCRAFELQTVGDVQIGNPTLTLSRSHIDGLIYFGMAVGPVQTMAFPFSS